MKNDKLLIIIVEIREKYVKIMSNYEGGFIMLLYESNGKKIDVYSFMPDERTLIEYRRENIRKQNIDELFYYFETTNETIINRFVNAEDLDTRFLEHNSEDWWSEIKQQRFIPKSKELIQQEILEKYIKGEFSQVIPTRTFIPDDGTDCYLKNYLATGNPTSTYSNIEKRIIYTIENLISLPNNLCALQLLLNGEFSKILGSWLDYSEPIQFFQAIKEAEISSDELKKILLFNLVNETYDEVKNKIETTTEILQKVKKIG